MRVSIKGGAALFEGMVLRQSVCLRRLGGDRGQMALAARLTKLTATAMKAACTILRLVQDRDGAYAQPAEHVLDTAEVDTIEALVPSLEGTTKRQENPHPPRGLARASWVIARLGGWNCYGKPPGPITMFNGMQRFHAIHQGRRLKPIVQ